jgi:hypothetical protein
VPAAYSPEMLSHRAGRSALAAILAASSPDGLTATRQYAAQMATDVGEHLGFRPKTTGLRNRLSLPELDSPATASDLRRPSPGILAATTGPACCRAQPHKPPSLIPLLVR